MWRIWEENERLGEDMTRYPRKGHPQGVSLHSSQSPEHNQDMTGHPQGVPLHSSQSPEHIQNVGIPLAGVLPGGTHPDDKQVDNDTQSATQAVYHIRPISTILDPEPALLAHQRALAEWMAIYYVTPLAQVAVKMLPPGLMQRSKVVLHLINDEEQATHSTHDQQTLTRLHALIGLLLADGELDVERLKRCSGQNKQKKYYRRLYQAV